VGAKGGRASQLGHLGRPEHLGRLGCLGHLGRLAFGRLAFGRHDQLAAPEELESTRQQKIYAYFEMRSVSLNV
jgi:hypothetical protein